MATKTPIVTIICRTVCTGRVEASVVDVPYDKAHLLMWKKLRCPEGPLSEVPKSLDDLVDMVDNAFGGEYCLVLISKR